MEPSSTQSEHELFAIQREDLEARELEVERRTRALNLNAVRDAEIRPAAPSLRSSQTRTSQEQAPIKPKHANSHAASQRSLPLKKGYPSGIKVTSTVTIKTEKPLSASPRREQDKTGQARI